MTKVKVFSVREAMYVPGGKEVWRVYPREPLNYPDGNWGYAMSCTVFDSDDNELYTDTGETYEIHYYAKQGCADYKSLEADLLKVLKSLGLNKNIKVKE